MSLIPMNVEQMRRKAQENAKAKLQQQKDFKNQVDTMSRHDVGNLYDVRAIMKSKQFKEQKNHYNLQMAEQELEDLLQGNRLYNFKSTAEDFIKRVTGRETDSFNVRETGKFISELINQIKDAYEVKD
tara:strand:+ start:77 stop:460 length:384 start_codon:yes stop_codon:yes gene_type:complete